MGQRQRPHAARDLCYLVEGLTAPHPIWDRYGEVYIECRMGMEFSCKTQLPFGSGMGFVDPPYLAPVMY